MFDLSPFRPARELTNLRREMDRLFQDFWGGRDVMSIEGDWIPAIDISETDDAIVVKAEAPGMEPNEIDISLSNDVLIIKGEKKQKTEEKKENYHRIETRYGSFSRAFRLPAGVVQENVEAKYDKGVLKITLPKKEEVKPKQINIKVGE